MQFARLLQTAWWRRADLIPALQVFEARQCHGFIVPGLLQLADERVHDPFQLRHFLLVLFYLRRLRLGGLGGRRDGG